MPPSATVATEPPIIPPQGWYECPICDAAIGWPAKLRLLYRCERCGAALATRPPFRYALLACLLGLSPWMPMACQLFISRDAPSRLLTMGYWMTLPPLISLPVVLAAQTLLGKPTLRRGWGWAPADQLLARRTESAALKACLPPRAPSPADFSPGDSSPGDSSPAD